MTNETQNQAPDNQSVSIAANLPRIATVKKLCDIYHEAELTPSKARAQIFDAEDRVDSLGRVIPGNGLAQAGAIIRRAGSRSVFIDVLKYGEWLAGKGGSNTTQPDMKLSVCTQPDSKMPNGKRAAKPNITLDKTVATSPAEGIMAMEGGAPCL